MPLRMTQAPSLDLFTHAGEECAPVLGVQPSSLPVSVDLHKLMLRDAWPEPQPLNSSVALKVPRR